MLVEMSVVSVAVGMLFQWHNVEHMEEALNSTRFAGVRASVEKF